MTDFLVGGARIEPIGRTGNGSRSVPNRQVLVVAGMHRSGTSAFARVLGFLGAALPADLAEGAGDNESGFWEPLPIKELDDELLAVAGSRWDDVIVVPDEWYRSSAAGAYVARAVALLEQEYADTPLFVLKDPRICRMLPFWQRVFAEAGVAACYVLPLRNPLEVAASLKRRNDFPPEKSLLLWLEHVLSAERSTRRLPRTLPRYEDLLDDPWRVVEEMGQSLGIVWPRSTTRTRSEIDRFLARDLRHHAFEDQALGSRRDVAAWITRTYGALLALATGVDDEAEPYDTLDQVWAELRQADSAYGSLLASLEADLEEAHDEACAAALQLQTRDAELGRLESELEAGARSLEIERQRQREQLQRQVAGLSEQLAASEAERKRLEGELESRLAAHSDDVREADRLRAELVAREQEIAALEVERQRQYDRLEAQLAARTELAEALARVEQEHEVALAQQSQAAEEQSRLETELLAVVELRGSAQTQLVAGARERERLQHELEARVADHSATLLELGRVRSQLVGAQADLTRRSFRGRLRRMLRWPLVKLYRLWVAIAPAGVRLRARYASQLGSWLVRPTPTRLGWVKAYFSLRRSGAFDYRYYAHRYPEVVRARMNPLMHYIEHGAEEGRDPSARFSTAAYLAHWPGLDPRRRNPLYEARRRGDTDVAAPAALAAPPPATAGGAVAVAAEPDRTTSGDEAPARPLPTDWRLPSITGIDVLCLPIIDWHYRFQRPQQLATQFAAAGHRVFYAETKFHPDGDAVEVGWLADGVWSVGLPGPHEKVIYTSTLESAELERILAALDALRRVASISEAIVVVDLPFWAPLALEAARRFGWRVIYDCMDHHAGFLDEGFGSAAVRIAIEENEEALLHESDAVLATSRLLFERVSPLARKALQVPNATDFAHFNGQMTEPEVDASLERPVIGYYGAISSWFDVELMAAAARARPHWSFVLVGSTVGANVTALEGLPNVRLEGERLYAEIPAYLHAFDVACIPFKLNALTQATNPVKFYEYLSAGKPIVATALPELEPYEGYYYSAHTAEEFVSQLERALHENSPEAASGRIALALKNTWSARWKDLERLIRSWFGRAAIVVLSYDNPEYLRQCLESIWAKTRYLNYDVYVVENAGNADVDAYLTAESERRERLHVIRPGENLGFARANNLAVQLTGDCEFVVLLNDDVVVTDGWLSVLLRHLEDETVGIVGPVTNWAGNEARVDVGYDELDGMDDFAASYTAAHAEETFDIASLAMYCVAVRRRLFDSIGGLDERFEVGMFEDDDFAQRVRDAGLRVVCAEDVFVHHWGRASFSRMEQEEYDAVFEANRSRFEEKWGCEWAPHSGR